jgi:hypothetical protein
VTDCVAAAAETVHHELRVELQPVDARISVVDNIQMPANIDSADFSLRSDFMVKASGLELILLGESDAGRLRHYRIKRLPADGKVQLNYAGKIKSGRIQRPFNMPESVFNPEGVYLDGGSGWVPRFHDYSLVTFKLQVQAPGDWEIISQGRRHESGQGYFFDMPHPQEDIYLLGGPYRRYSQMHDGIEIVVYLLQADDQLAQRYLQTTAEYIRLYSDWIGAYPYAKFAIVENRWQTGYGMPSFTLLGSRVIRLPFILHTSLPHEILHNWMGNGVYIDFAKGNWSEGLTAYMSDHYSNEQQGKGDEYRRKALERYANFAAEGRDFSLAEFKSRHDEASQAIGYSKSLMLFHMLRNQVGDELFNDGIRQFWKHYRFQYADFIDVIKQLYPGKDDYEAFVEQWLYRTGAPEITLKDAIVSEDADAYQLVIKIKQQQSGPVYSIDLPLEVTLQGEAQPLRERVTLLQKESTIKLKYKQRPQTVRLDPDYDVFRLLHAGERPASLGRLFGANTQVLVMPENATTEQKKAWRQLAKSWSGRYNNVEILSDNEIETLPGDKAIWLLGWENKLLETNRERFSSLTQHVSEQSALIGTQQLDADQHAVVLLDPDNSRKPLGFIGADSPESIALMARKLPHYSSYGVLAFKLPEAQNIIKQYLPVLTSPMVRQLD